MQEAIEKAFNNGLTAKSVLPSQDSIYYIGIEFYNVVIYSNNEVEFTFRRAEDGWTWATSKNLYEFIFATPFIDKLAGDYTYCESVSWTCPGECCRDCGEGSDIYLPDYHRCQMANIKDVEKLKEYVRGLI